MDTVAIDARGYSELKPYFEQIEALSDKAQLPALLGDLHKNGFGGFFYAGPSLDPKMLNTTSCTSIRVALALPTATTTS